MKIIEVKEIERLYTRGLKRTKKPVEIVVHGTAGGENFKVNTKEIPFL